MRATSNTGELSAIYHALGWIRKRRKKSIDSAVSPRYNLVSDVKLFSTRLIRPEANKRIITRIHALLDQVKHDTISISWNPAHTTADDPLWPKAMQRQIDWRLGGIVLPIILR